MNAKESKWLEEQGKGWRRALVQQSRRREERRKVRKNILQSLMEPVANDGEKGTENGMSNIVVKTATGHRMAWF